MNPDKLNCLVISASFNGNKFHPMPFNTEMVRAILEGRKTQTRRVINPQPDDIYCKNPEKVIARFEETGEDKELNLVYSRGDILWVREAFCSLKNSETGKIEYAYKVVNGCNAPSSLVKSNNHAPLKFKPGRYMPRDAARIYLQVENVWVHRIKEITANNILREGVKDYPEHPEQFRKDYLRKDFERLWDSINAGRGFGWSANPWVKVIQFRRLDI